MKFLEFRAEVEAVLADSIHSLGFEGAAVEVGEPPSVDYGDLASAVPIRLAKRSGKKPGDVAIELASAAMERAEGSRYIGTISPHRGGYLNFSLKLPPFINDSVEAIASGDLGGGRGRGVSVAVEHTGVNPNKALHIGHARNLVLGDSLARVLKFTGHDVKVLNYIDDSGGQVADVIVGFRYLGIPMDPPAGVKYDLYCGDKVYVRVNQEYSKDPALKEKRAAVIREIEKGEGEVALLARSVVERILRSQLTTCWRMGASYDLLNWESQIVHSGMWAQVFELMKQKSIVRYETEGENRGCWVIPDPETGEQKVVVRSDGSVVYVAKDIPYAAWKVGLVKDPFAYEVYEKGQPSGAPLYSTVLSGGKPGSGYAGADKVVTVIGSHQSYLQRIVAKVLERLSAGSSARYLHRGYELVALSKDTAADLGFEVEGEVAKMAGRKGLYVNVDLVLDSLKERAKAETKKRNPTDGDPWIDGVAEGLAVAALRYELLKQDPDKVIVFDMAESLRFEGDTGPYLMYTYARARRILDKTGGRPKMDEKSAARLTRHQEARLAKKMSMLDMSAQVAEDYLSPKEIARFAHDLAVVFNDFYEHVPVNKENDAEVRDARLALVDASSKVLAESMRLMGMPVKERI